MERIWFYNPLLGTNLMKYYELVLVNNAKDDIHLVYYEMADIESTYGDYFEWADDDQERVGRSHAIHTAQTAIAECGLEDDVSWQVFLGERFRPSQNHDFPQQAKFNRLGAETSPYR